MVPSSPCGPVEEDQDDVEPRRAGRRQAPAVVSTRTSAAPVSGATARSSSSCLVEASAPPSVSAWRAASWASARSGSPPTSQRPSLAMPIGTSVEAAPVDGGHHGGGPGERDLVLARAAAEHHADPELPGRFAMGSVVSDPGFPGGELLQPSPAGRASAGPPRPPLGEAGGDLLLGAAVGRAGSRRGPGARPAGAPGSPRRRARRARSGSPRRSRGCFMSRVGALRRCERHRLGRLLLDVARGRVRTPRRPRWTSGASAR